MTKVEEWPVISDDPAIQHAYEEMREAGESHNIAEMCAFATPPMSNTDREFLEGNCNGNQFEKQPGVGDIYKRQAAAAGVSTTGKVYKSSLAAFPGDPRAWVSGRGDVERVLDERGWGCEGSVTRKVQKVAEPTGGGVAESIVNEEVRSTIEDSPEPIKDVEGLKDSIIKKRKPHWAK